MMFRQTFSQFIQDPSRKRPQAVIISSVELHDDDTLLYFGRNNVWELESSVYSLCRECAQLPANQFFNS